MSPLNTPNFADTNDRIARTLQKLRREARSDKERRLHKAQMMAHAYGAGLRALHMMAAYSKLGFAYHKAMTDYIFVQSYSRGPMSFAEFQRSAVSQQEAGEILEKFRAAYPAIQQMHDAIMRNQPNEP